MNKQEKIELTKEVLKNIGLLGAVTAMVIAPGIAPLFKSIGKEEDRPHYKNMRINQTLKRLEKRGLVSTQMRDEKKLVSLTKKGRVLLHKINLSELKIEKPKKWDNKWRIIIFDIQESKRKIREQLRRLLIHLGFKKFQNSVWFFPYPCEKEINLLKQSFYLENNLFCLTSERFKDDRPLIKFFNL